MTLKHNVKLLLQLDSSGTRTIAEAFVKGEISEADLKMLNETTSFPAMLPAYTQEACIQNFITTLLPYMSDVNLFVITNQLFQFELKDKSKAFTNLNLAKILIREVAKRYESNGKLNHFAEHLKFLLLPNFKENSPTDITNFKQFIETNLSFLSLKLPETYYQNLAPFNAINLTILGSGHEAQDFINLLEMLLNLRSEMGGDALQDRPEIVKHQEDVDILKQNIRKINIKITTTKALLSDLTKKNLKPDPVIMKELTDLVTLNAILSKELNSRKNTVNDMLHNKSDKFYKVEYNRQPLSDERINSLKNMINTCKTYSLEYAIKMNECYRKFNTEEDVKVNVLEKDRFKNKLQQLIDVQHILEEMLLNKEIYHDLFTTLYKNKNFIVEEKQEKCQVDEKKQVKYLFEKEMWAECIQQFAYNLASNKTPTFIIKDRNDNNSTPKLN